MPFAQKPAESRKQIDKAGTILINDEASSDERTWAINLANQWRACHAYPINTFQATLRKNVKDFPGNVIVAQRLKRMPTIINKLKRYPTMKLTTMQDIGGVRAVLKCVDDIYRLATIYKSKNRFRHELVDEKDYIQDPRNEDGYRSLHLIYKYKNLPRPDYDGLRIEIQIRTRLQHTWATAVETMGTMLGQALKSRQGDKKWIDFFAIISSAFALIEKTQPIPRFKNCTQQQVFKAVKDVTEELGAIDLMKGFSATADYISKKSSKEQRSHYYLLVLNSSERTVKIRPYNRDSIDKALIAYSHFEQEAADGKKIEPVLVSAGSLDVLRKAYPNFFLDMREFIGHIEKICDSAILNSGMQ